MPLLNLGPERLAEALPSLSARRRSGSWPVGLLPVDALARDIASFGYAYKRGLGFTRNGANGPRPVDDYEVASAAAMILNLAADRLPSPTPLADQWFTAADALESEADRLQLDAHATLGDDYELAEATAEPLTNSLLRAAASYRALTESPEGLRLAREHDAYGDQFEDYIDGLRRTARDVKASPSAQKTLLSALRASLPAPGNPADEDEEEDLEAFLASLDRLALLKRSELLTRYLEEGSPCSLTGPELRARASARWGEPRLLHGVYVYRPAKAAA